MTFEQWISIFVVPSLLYP